MHELLIAFVIVSIIVLLALKSIEERDVPVVVLKEIGSDRPSLGEVCGNVLEGNHQTYDGCMASYVGCGTYNVEPVLREMNFFNNLYDKENSYEPELIGGLSPFARVYDH